MKKLNRKGFTLIELLAVIVILAIIVVVTVPTIISTIADARVSSLWNLAGEVANSYNTGVAQDLLTPGKALQGATATTDWTCIGEVATTSEGKTLDNLAEVLDLSEKDLVLTGNAPNDDDLGGSNYAPAQDICSAIKLNGASGAVVFLNAKAGGKFAISGKSVYALSTDDNGVQIAAPTE